MHVYKYVCVCVLCVHVCVCVLAFTSVHISCLAPQSAAGILCDDNNAWNDACTFIIIIKLLLCIVLDQLIN